MKGEKDLLTLQIKAGGPLEGITVTADSKGNVKGYVGNPNVVLHANAQGKLDVAGAVGVGFNERDQRHGHERALCRADSAPDKRDRRGPYLLLCYQRAGTFFSGSGRIDEKDNTVKQAGGFIIQLMPFTEKQ